MSRIVDIEPLLKKYDGMNEGTEFSPIHFINDLMALEQLLFTEKEELLRVSKGAVKARQGRFVIYDVEWLKKNFYSTEEKIYGQPKQPCEDCISRDSLNDAISKLTYWHFENGRLVVGGGGIKSETVYKVDDVGRMPDVLPSVTPQRQKGKWKRIAGFEDCNYDKCSVCGAYQLFYYGKPSTNYCPNCGAEMNKSGGGEDEDGKSL